jgi:hypothetical protein
MSSFDYTAPAELFLSKPVKVGAQSTEGSRQRLRRSTTLS